MTSNTKTETVMVKTETRTNCECIVFNVQLGTWHVSFWDVSRPRQWKYCLKIRQCLETSHHCKKWIVDNWLCMSALHREVQKTQSTRINQSRHLLSISHNVLSWPVLTTNNIMQHNTESSTDQNIYLLTEAVTQKIRLSWAYSFIYQHLARKKYRQIRYNEKVSAINTKSCSTTQSFSKTMMQSRS